MKNILKITIHSFVIITLLLTCKKSNKTVPPDGLATVPLLITPSTDTIKAGDTLTFTTQVAIAKTGEKGYNLSKAKVEPIVEFGYFVDTINSIGVLKSFMEDSELPIFTEIGSRKSRIIQNNRISDFTMQAIGDSLYLRFKVVPKVKGILQMRYSAVYAYSNEWFYEGVLKYKYENINLNDYIHVDFMTRNKINYGNVDDFNSSKIYYTVYVK